jgi:hypothetical protein
MDVRYSVNMHNQICFKYYSLQSYAAIVVICKATFAESDIAQRRTLGVTKVSYLIMHGFAPQFRELSDK